MRKKKSFIVPIIILIAVFFAIGYAYLTTTLTISGVTDIDRNSWDVYFDNIQILPGSVEGSQVIDEPEVVDDTTVTFHINLKKPGDYFEFLVDAKNDGTIDAMVSSVSKKLNGVEINTLPAYLNYVVKYRYGGEIEDNHILASETLETYKIRVEYKSDINPSDLPSSAQVLELSFGVEYIQADEKAEDVNSEFYHYSFMGVHLNQEMPYWILTYDTYQEAVSNFGNPFFLKHTAVNGIVKTAYIGFIKNGNVYYLQGGGATYNESTGQYNYDSIYFEANKAILQSAFDSTDCDGGTSSYFCENNSANLKIQVEKNGKVMVFDNQYLWGCLIENDGAGCDDTYG